MFHDFACTTMVDACSKNNSNNRNDECKKNVALDDRVFRMEDDDVCCCLEGWRYGWYFIFVMLLCVLCFFVCFVFLKNHKRLKKWRMYNLTVRVQYY